MGRKWFQGFLFGSLPAGTVWWYLIFCRFPLSLYIFLLGILIHSLKVFLCACLMLLLGLNAAAAFLLSITPIDSLKPSIVMCSTKPNKGKCRVVHLWRNSSMHQCMLRETAWKAALQKRTSGSGGHQGELQPAVCHCSKEG